MTTMVVAGLLLGHGLLHASYLVPRPPARPGAPAWPFELQRSWLLSPLGAGAGTTRAIGTVLVLATVASFAAAALAALGVGPAGLWAVAVAAGAVTSLATLGLFFHPWLVLGLVIDVVVLYAVAVAGWVPSV